MTNSKVFVQSWHLQKESATKQEILSLVGLLQHATKVVRSGRTFVAWMYQSAAKLKKLKYLLGYCSHFPQIFIGDIHLLLTGMGYASCATLTILIM